MRIGILASHPIQYQSPWFRALAKQCDLTVYFAHRQSAQEQAEAGFGVAFDWDVDLTSGYKHHFLRNVARRPSVNRYDGCDTPEIADIIGRQQDYKTTDDETKGQQDIKSGPVVSGQWSVVNDRRRFDAFIVMGWYLKWYRQAVRECRLTGIPVLVRGDSQLHTPRPLLKRAAMEVRQRLLLRQFDGFLSPGQRHREYLRHFGVSAEKIFFVPHFVENDRFARQAESIRDQRSEIRSQWGIPEEAFVPLFVGKFIPKKRPLDLVKAAQLLLDSHPQLKVHLLFVGSGALGGELRASSNVLFDAQAVQRSENNDQRLERTNLTSDLRPPTSDTKPPASFAGFLNQTQIPKAYVAADVLVLPSESETWGLSVNEAMACGLPVIVSDAVGCAPDLIKSNETGFTFSAGNCAQLAERLTTLIEFNEGGHDFRAILASKLRNYSVEAALSGTLAAISMLKSGSTSSK